MKKSLPLLFIIEDDEESKCTLIYLKKIGYKFRQIDVKAMDLLHHISRDTDADRIPALVTGAGTFTGFKEIAKVTNNKAQR